MGAPSVSWPALDPADYGIDEALTETECQELIQGLFHLREVWGASYSPKTAPHDHDNVNSVQLDQPSPNFLSDSWACSAGPQAYLDFAKSAGVTAVANNGFLLTNSGDYIYQRFPGGEDTSPGASLYDSAMVGYWGTSGADFVVSVFVKATAALAAGRIDFGLAEASTSTFSINGDSTTARGAINYSSITTDWTRFWFPITKVWGALAAADNRFLLRCSASFSGGSVYVNGMDVRLGSTLTWPHPCPMDGEKALNGGLWSRTPTAFGNAWDYSVAITNATELTPA